MTITKDQLIKLLQDSPTPGDTPIWIYSADSKGGRWPAMACIFEQPTMNFTSFTLTDQNVTSLSYLDHYDVVTDPEPALLREALADGDPILIGQRTLPKDFEMEA